MRCRKTVSDALSVRKWGFRFTNFSGVNIKKPTFLVVRVVKLGDPTAILSEVRHQVRWVRPKKGVGIVSKDLPPIITYPAAGVTVTRDFTSSGSVDASNVMMSATVYHPN